MANTGNDLLRTLPALPGYTWNDETKDLDEIKVSPEEYAFVREGEDVLRVTAERFQFADYYDEFGKGYPYIHPDLEAWAEKHGGFWEWENPSNIGFYKL